MKSRSALSFHLSTSDITIKDYAGVGRIQLRTSFYYLDPDVKNDDSLADCTVLERFDSCLLCLGAQFLSCLYR